ncbi:MAG: hypothetical protein ACMX3H_20075 [Sodalis sp. (in: enterobacteria)]|uniref:hypothetical protein n=1 Tax=Sodalis sp. (in: enterobacteria) TaxID=1898979 RepID=UPI0039E59D25
MLNISPPGDHNKVIKPAGHQTAQQLIDYLLRKHRGEIFASLYAADTAPAALDRETLKQILPLYANAIAMMAEQSEANTGAMLACASALPGKGLLPPSSHHQVG